MYEFTPFFNEFASEIFDLINQKGSHFLSDLNIKLIEKGCELLKIKKKFCRSSEFNIQAANKESGLLRYAKN